LKETQIVIEVWRQHYNRVRRNLRWATSRMAGLTRPAMASRPPLK